MVNWSRLREREKVFEADSEVGELMNSLTRQLERAVAAVLAGGPSSFRLPSLHLRELHLILPISKSHIMLGINYESSDEEDIAPAKEAEVSYANLSQKGPIATNIELLKPPVTNAPAPIPKPDTLPIEGPSVPEDVLNRPSQGPSVPPEDDGLPADSPPGSPYTSMRSKIQNLTLPTIPNWDIPPSPPGSPPLKATIKFTQFLEFKSKGQHFNSRLETSSVLRDPNHLRKLYTFAGIDENDQYMSTLSDGLGVPAIWPEWAYGDELNASQKKLKANEPRRPVSFVPARPTGSSSKSTPSTKGIQSGKSAGKRKELEYRGGREGGGSSSKQRSRSRSPKRRRSQSKDLK
jgi:hypothetical protein